MAAPPSLARSRVPPATQANSLLILKIVQSEIAVTFFRRHETMSAPRRSSRIE